MRLNFKQLSLLWIVLFGFCFWQTHAQELILKFKTQVQKNQVVLDSIGYNNRFDSMQALQQEIDILQKRLYYMGYLGNRILNTEKKETIFFDLALLQANRPCKSNRPPKPQSTK